MVILADRLDRVGEAILIAQRARRIAVESIVAGMGLSLAAMAAATFGWLAPVPAAMFWVTSSEPSTVLMLKLALVVLKPVSAPATPMIRAPALV